MTPQHVQPRLNRRLLPAAAALGGILIGLLVMRLISGDGDDLAVGIAPQGARVPAPTTTSLALPTLSVDPVLVLPPPRDPFGQIVTVPDAPQAGQTTQTLPAPAVQPARAGQTTQTTQRASTATTTSITTTTTAAAHAVQPQSATPAAPPPPTPPPASPPNLVWGVIGPVAVPGVPVNVCVVRGTSSCTSSAPATSVTLTAAATIAPAATMNPTILPAACSNGPGAALLVNTGSAGTLIYVSVTIIANGSPTVVGLTLPAPNPDESVILSACVAPGVGVPSMGASAPPPPTGGLVDGLLKPVLGLLGGAPVGMAPAAAPTLPVLPLK